MVMYLSLWVKCKCTRLSSSGVASTSYKCNFTARSILVQYASNHHPISEWQKVDSIISEDIYIFFLYISLTLGIDISFVLLSCSWLRIELSLEKGSVSPTHNVGWLEIITVLTAYFS